jgi:dihydrofolate reductase
MRRVVADEFMTLDGVVRAPSYPDEDVAGDFGHVRGAGGYLLGRGTYEIFAAHWPDAPQDQQLLAEPLNTLPKYVASTTLAEPLGPRQAPVP